MSDRRSFLLGLPLLGAAAAASADATRDGTVAHDRMFSRDSLQGPGQVPETMVETHDGRVVRLYDDLVRGRVVLVNFMAIDNEPQFPISTRLAEVARLLGPSLGTSVHMISITNDPSRDTAERLRTFAAELGAPAGWTFVRTSGEGMAMLTARFYRHARNPALAARTRADVVHYGNDAVGLWAAFPATIRADDAVMRLASVSPDSGGGAPGRAGPRRLEEAGPSFNNRVVST